MTRCKFINPCFFTVSNHQSQKIVPSRACRPYIIIDKHLSVCFQLPVDQFRWLNAVITQDVHSGRRNGALYGRKQRFTALIFTLFHRNPSVRITTAVSGRFLLRNDHRFTPFPVVFRRFIAVSGRLRAVLLDLGIDEMKNHEYRFLTLSLTFVRSPFCKATQ
jgi:hypothetical protein